MHSFLIAVVWITSVGSVLQFLVMLSASWMVFAGHYSFFELDVTTFISQVVPWLYWIKTFMIALLGDLGELILTIPILIITPIKFVAGLAIGIWAYRSAKRISATPPDS